MTPHDLIDRLSCDPGRDMDAHLLVLYSIARFLPASLAVEIGVDDGSSTLPLLMGVRDAGGHLHSVDVGSCDAARSMVRDSGYDDAWTFHNMKSVQFMQMHCAPNSIDLVFIDGDHSYDGVLADWVWAKDIVHPGGLVLFHDYMNKTEFPGIARVIDWQIKPYREKYEIATLPYGWGLSIVRIL